LNDPVPNAPNAASRWRMHAHLPVLPPLIALTEIAVLFCVLVLADALYPGLELFDVRPHPFWIPVLLLSLQYGTASGLLAAVVAIGLRAWAGFPEQTGTETYFTYLVKIWIEPILWIGAAVLLGQFRLRQIGQKQELLFQVRELASQRGALADYAKNLREHCTALERRIAGRSEPGVLLALQAMDAAYAQGATATDDQIGEALTRVIGLAMPGAQASLYAADPTGLRLTARTGAGIDREIRPWIASTEPLFQAIVNEAVSASVLSAEGERRLGGAGVAAVPVFAPGYATGSQSRRIVGMLKIETIDPASLGEACSPALATVARAFAPALDARAARTGQQPVEVTIQTPGAQTHPAQKIWRHLRWFSVRSVAAEFDTATPAKSRSGTPR
jgi:hypothetical protein